MDEDTQKQIEDKVDELEEILTDIENFREKMNKEIKDIFDDKFDSGKEVM